MANDFDPRTPVHVTPFTLLANETRSFNMAGSRVLFLAASTSLGTTAGEISIALGETGEFFDWSPADGLILSEFGAIRLRNNTASARSGVMLHSADPSFRLLNAPRGL